MPRPRNINKSKPVVKQDLPDKLSCTMCGELKPPKEYYQSFHSIHKRTGKVPYCKSCLKKMSTDSNGNVTKIKIQEMLKSIDRPYIDSLFEAALSDPNETVGNYMKNISMVQFKDLKWGDSEFESKILTSEDVNDDELIYSEEWHGKFTRSDLRYLDDYLKSLRKDFKITTRNHIDYARKIAKASLAMDKAYEDMINGEDSGVKYKSLRETFDTLSKSAQFAEVGRGINDVSLGNFGVIFDRVEKHQWIPKHQPTNKDMYDNLLEQFANINKSL